MSAFKFSGTCELDKHDGLYEYENETLIGSVPWASDAMDFTCDIEDNLEHDDEIIKLKDGLYHIFFIGEAVVSGHDYGDGYESELEVVFYEIHIYPFSNIIEETIACGK